MSKEAYPSVRQCVPPYPFIPIPNQSAIFVGFVIGSSAYYRIRLRRLFLAALISSLIWNRNYLSRDAFIAVPYRKSRKTVNP